MAKNMVDLDELFAEDFFDHAGAWGGSAPPMLFPSAAEPTEANINGNNLMLGNSQGKEGNGTGGKEAPVFNANYDPRNVPVMVPANPIPSESSRPRRTTKTKDVKEYEEEVEPVKRPPKRKAKANPKLAAMDDYDDEIPLYKMSEAQKVERRSRNREHAKRSRLRKKFLLESLQSQIDALEKENGMLRSAVMKECGSDQPNKDRAKKMMRDICVECGIAVPEELKVGGKAGQDDFTPLTVPSGFGPVNTLMEPDLRLINALSTSQQNFAISDPTLPDNPIVYVSQGFLNLTGYKLEQVLGRNCRFLQGPDTDQKAVEVIRQGVEKGVDTSICLLNYKADGTPFWNQFFVACLRDSSGTVVNFVGVQCEVSKATVESQFKKKNGL